MWMRRLQWALVVALWIGSVALTYGLMQLGDYGSGDFHLYYYPAAQDALDGQLDYLTDTGQHDGTLGYPPLLAQLLMPLARALDATQAARVWFVLQVIALILLLAALARGVPSHRRVFYWGAAALYIPLFEALRVGQMSVLLLVLIGFAWIAVKRDKPRLAGVLLAFAAWIKIYPAIFLLYFLWKRNWGVVWGGVLGGVGFALFQIAVSGVDVMIEFFRLLFQLAGRGEPQNMWVNNSIYGFTARLFEPYGRSVPLWDNPTLRPIVTVALYVVVIGALFMITSRSKPHMRESLRHHTRFDLEYSLCVVTMLFISPWVYIDGFSLLWLPLVILIPHLTLRQRLVLALGLLLIVIAFLLMWQPDVPTSTLVLSAGFYGLVLVYAVNVHTLYAGAPVRVMREELSTV